MHSEAPLEEYLPDAHEESQGVARPVREEKVPLPQSTHTEEDVAAVVVEYFPMPHKSHPPLCPLLSWYCPEGLLF